MPEGHTTHRLARLHREVFGGRRVCVTSPQGRFAQGAALLDGRVLSAAEAHGKHLFYRWEGLVEVLHVHLGLIGTFHMHRGDSPDPSGTTRLRFEAGGVAADLVGPMTCELIDPDRESQVRDPLGPDPLRSDARGEAMCAALRSRRTPVAAALLDQTVVAGVGNVFRAEALHVVGINPLRPSSSLTSEECRALWSTLRQMLRTGERLGRIVTVRPKEVGARTRARVPDGERLYVYRRNGVPCRRCGTLIAALDVGGRRAFWCPQCQPEGGGARRLDRLDRGRFS